ncbi:hypothetical protein LWI28_002999 [Acer negundo]|uniref:Uncharacterized protein n=1 Tax=Acer negundo TaxID=4023 RepID=A0AAD5NHY5_ACENE|nr:hypothetical protein LWI28_002999 [Acer negundo]
MTRTLLSMVHAPLNLWVEVALTSVYLINLLHMPTLEWSSPYFMLFRRNPSYSHLCIFWCACFPHLGSYVSNKLQPRSTEFIFLSKHVLAGSSPFATLELHHFNSPPAAVPYRPPTQLELTELPDHQQPVPTLAVTEIIAAPAPPCAAPAPPEPAAEVKIIKWFPKEHGWCPH